MSSPTTTVTVQCPSMLTDAGDAHGTEEHRCEGEVEVELMWEEGESNWGADADGNRGMYVPGCWVVSDIPKKCEMCDGTFTQKGLDAIEREAQELADNLDGPEEDEPDYEPDGLYDDGEGWRL